MQNDLSAAPPAAPRGLKVAGIVAACVAIGVVGYGTFDRNHALAQSQNWSDAQAIPTVHLVAATPGAAGSALTLPGTMEAFNSAKLYARVGGYLKAWYRDIGAHVEAGTALGQVETPELDQQIIQARADLASAAANQQLAASTASRWKDLVSDGSVAKQEADEKSSDLLAKNALANAARANLGRLLAMKGFATIVAPFSGTVTARNADIGDLVSAGQGATAPPLFTVADTRKIRIYVSVPQDYSAGLKPGLTAHLTVPDYPNRTFTAQVLATSGAISAQTGTLLVQLIADDADGALKPGGYAQVSFDVPVAAGMVQIPATALLFRKEGVQVATLGAGNKVVLKPISIGRDLGPTLEVTKGLSPQDKIIDNPPDSIQPAELVRVADSHNG